MLCEGRVAEVTGSAGKGMGRSMALTLAREGAGLLLAGQEAWRHGVTANVIGPGPIDEIASLEAAVEQCDHGPDWLSRAAASPQDITEGVAFLCSEAGRFITGCELPYPYRASIG